MTQTRTAIVGFAIAYVISIILGGTQIVNPLLPLLGDWVLRLAIILFCLMVTAITNTVLFRVVGVDSRRVETRRQEPLRGKHS